MAGGSIGYATLPIIPSFKGVGSGLAKQISAPLRSAGATAGAAGGTAAGGGFAKGLGRAVAGVGKVTAGIVGGGLALGVGAIGVVAGTAFSKGLDRAISIQNAQAKLTGLGHSTQTVTKIMDNALASVKGTAFGLGDAAGVAAGAVAAGIAPGQQLQRVLGLVADSATIAGTDMGSMGSIFNKVAASGKLQGDVIAQLQDAGVPVLQFVAKEIGKTAAETADLASEGKIDFATFSNAMEAGLGGAALSSGKTAEGAWDNVGAALGRLGVSFMSGAVATAPRLFTSVAGATDRASAALAPYAAIINTKVAGAMKGLATWIDGIDFNVVVSRISSFVTTAQAKFVQVKAALASAFSGGGAGIDPSKILGNLGSIGNIIAPLMPIFVSLGQAIGSISGSIGDLIGSGIQVLPPLISVLSGALQFLADNSQLVAPLVIGIVGAMVLFRGAQAAANAAELGALPIRAANVLALFAQARANQALATQMAITNGQQAVSRAAMLPATAQVILNTGALVANRAAMVATRVALGVATVAQWAWNAALTANPIGLIIVAIVALVAGLVWFFTQTKVGQAIWSGFVSFLGTAWTWIQTIFTVGLTAIGTFFVNTWNNIVAANRLAWSIISGIVMAGVNAVRAIVLAVIGAVRAGWNAGWSAIVNVARVVWSAIVLVVTTYINLVRSVVLAVVNGVRAGWSAGMNAISAVGRAVWSAIVGYVTANVNAVRSVVTAVISTVRSVWSAGWNAVSGAVSAAAGLVRSIVSGMASAVSSAITNVVSFFSGIQGKVLGALSGAGSWLVSVGRNIISGLISGLKAMGSSILSAVTGPIKSAISGAKSLLGIHSPSRVFRQIGDYIGQGLRKGIDGSTAGVRSAMKGMTNALISEFDKQQRIRTKAAQTIASLSAGNNPLRKTAAGRAQIAAQIAAANRTIASQPLTQGVLNRGLSALSGSNALMLTLATRQDKYADRLKAANKKLATAQKTYNDYKSSVVQSLGTLDVTKAQTGAGIVSALTTQLADVKQFTSVMAKLRKAGLDATTYKQFISAGVDALPLATNLLAGGSSQIKQVASLQGQLNKASTSFATSAATDLYGAGVNAAKGLVKGIQSQQAAIAKQMRAIANSMVSSVKRALGIHSPSRVFYGLGLNTGQGYVNALSTMTRPARDALARMVTPQGLQTPTLDVAGASEYSRTASALAAARAAMAVPAAPTGDSRRSGPLVEFSGNVGMDPAAILREADDRARQAQDLENFDYAEVLA